MDESASIHQFSKNGYAVVKGLLGASTVGELREALAKAIYSATISRRYGLVEELYTRSVPLHERELFVQFEPKAIRKEGEQTDLVRKVANLQTLPRFAALLDGDGPVIALASQILGPNPVLLHYLAQLKPPGIGSAKCWHQDNAYFSVVPIDAVLGVWVALHDTDCRNGCLSVVPGAHLDGPMRHVLDGECSIPAAAIDQSRVRAIPISAGDAVIFNGLLPHSSPPNESQMRRWSLTFHFRSCNSQIASNEAFSAIFKNADGIPCGCSAAAREGPRAVRERWSD